MTQDTTDITLNKASAAERNLLMRRCLQKVATGPEYSKDLTQEEAYGAASCLLEDGYDEVQAAVLLIALRMKRETNDENIGFLKAIRDKTEHMTVDVEHLADIADPYDGYTRCLPMSPFLPAVLAACGQPAFSHGVETVGPKYGATHRKILRAAGVDVDLSPAQAAKQIESVGWAYLDQSRFCLALYALTELRTRIVKRPVLTTVEVLAHPLSGRRATHLVTGYVHKAYPPVYMSLARAAEFNSCVIVRGVEGGVVPSLRQPAGIHQSYDGCEDVSSEATPQALDIQSDTRAVPLPDLPEAPTKGDDIAPETDIDALSQAAAAVGLRALNGERGTAYDSLVYAGALALAHVRRDDALPAVAATVRKALDSGAALACFKAGIA